MLNLFSSTQSVELRRRRLGDAVCVLVLLLLFSALATAEDSKFSDLQRQQIIRAFLAETPFVHHALPRGKVGIRIEGKKLTPPEAELNQLIAEFGPAAKPGERAKITAVRFVHHGIVFDINGGPVKRKKWSDRVSIGVSGANTSNPSQNLPTDADVNNNAKGSFILLELKEDAASVTPDQIKELLAPVLDFKAMSVAEAYQKSLPPLLAAAVKNHHALVGMDKEMVTYAVGRPPHRLRETKENQEYEEWIFGTPPQDVEFIRFIGDKVVSIEDMKVSGEKVVRTQDEVGDLNGTLDASAQKRKRPDSASSPEEGRSSPPSLLRPDEKQPTTKDANRDPNPNLPPDPAPPPAGPN